MHFKDGQSAYADVVVGADGVHSKIRDYLLGVEAAKPQFTGAILYRSLAPTKSAIEILGEEHAQNATMLIERCLCYPIDFGKTVNIVAFEFVDHWPHEQRTVPANHSELAAKYTGWGEPAQGDLKGQGAGTKPWKTPASSSSTSSAELRNKEHVACALRGIRSDGGVRRGSGEDEEAFKLGDEDALDLTSGRVGAQNECRCSGNLRGKPAVISSFLFTAY
ncbi:MAG: hypothetical protein Q9202_004339 [Teloschistes flavicans]